MDKDFATAGERTVRRLHDAVASGRPLMIPGAGERRRQPAMLPAAIVPAPAVLFDRARLEHEWEGGGAPEMRTGVPSWRLMSWLRRSLR